MSLPEGTKYDLDQIIEQVQILADSALNVLQEIVETELDSGKNATVEFFNALRNLVHLIIVQATTFSTEFFGRFYQQFVGLKHDFEHAVHDIKTLPELQDTKTLNEALWGGTTYWLKPWDVWFGIWSSLDLMVLCLFWYCITAKIGKDFIKSFFVLLASLMTIHSLLKSLHALIYVGININSHELLIAMYLSYKSYTTFLALGGIALVLTCLATHLNRRPPNTLDWKMFVPLLCLSLSMSLLFILGLHSRRIYWTMMVLNMGLVFFNGYVMLVALMMFPCKKAKFSRFEKNVAVIDAKSNLGWVMVYQSAVINTLLVADFLSTFSLSSYLSLFQLTTCIVSKLTRNHFPCVDKFFLFENSVFFRPLTVLLPALLLIPSLRQSVCRWGYDQSIIGNGELANNTDIFKCRSVRGKISRENSVVSE